MQKIISEGMKITLLINLFFNLFISYYGYSGQGQTSRSEVFKIGKWVSFTRIHGNEWNPKEESGKWDYFPRRNPLENF